MKNWLKKSSHKDKKIPRCQGRSAVDKTLLVFGMIQKNGYLIAQEVPNAKMKTLVPIIRENVKKGSKLYSDELYVYSGLDKCDSLFVIFVVSNTVPGCTPIQ